MTFRLRFLLLLTLALWPFAATAQPLFRYEHDWTVIIAGRTYGIREVGQTPGEFRRTQVWFVQCSRDVSLRASAILVLIGTSLAAGVFVLWYATRRAVNLDRWPIPP